MGVVVAAHHLELDSKVAIKFLLPETLGNPDAVARFAREARAAVRIKSEHVARVSDVGKLESGAPYMVMEFLEGLDLSQWLEQRGPLPIEQAVEFILQASEAIAEAHSLGIVHRDLKPANLFVVRRPDGGLSVKVLDFGISKMASLTGSGGEGSMTKTSTMLGSPLYMSPEHLQSSKDVDTRTDIWALGVILYELVTGKPPFGGEHLAELMFSIVSAPPTPMRSYLPQLSDGFEAVIQRCLQKRRDARFSSIAEFAGALLPFAPQRALASVERITGVATGAFAHSQASVALGAGSLDRTGAPAASAGTQASWGNTAVEKGRSTRLVVGGVGAAAVLVAGLVVARGLTGAGSSMSSATGSTSAVPMPVASASTPEGLEPGPALVVPSATTSSAPQAPSAPSSVRASGAPAISTRSTPTSRTRPKPIPNPPTTPPASRDPWGGSQH